MEPHDLVVYATGGLHPDWALAAVEGGVRTALALLGAPRDPASIVLTGRRLADREHELSPGSELVARGDERDEGDRSGRPYAHTPSSIYVSYSGVLATYLGEGPRRREHVEPALAYAAGAAASCFSATWSPLGEAGELLESDVPGWDEALLENRDPFALRADLTGAIASGFRLAPAVLGGEARTLVVRFFLARLSALEAAGVEGVLTSGPLAGAVDAFCREVRLARTPGRAGAGGFGLPVEGREDVRALIAWHRDERPWPFTDRLI